MSTWDDLTTGQPGMAGIVSRIAQRWGQVSRRDVLARTAVVGSAMAVDPRAYILRPGSAYGTVCGPGASATSGWTVFCCTVNNGVNACPPGTFAAGWWKAASSSWCGGGYRYIVDCNATCSSCTSGCGGDHICDRECWSCSCRKGGRAGTCDQRRECCNAFRYGQCNTHIRCSGGVACRVVSCVPPYRWEACNTTSLQDNATSEHNAPCLPGWSPLQKKYDAMGAQRSFLRASTGPLRSVGDARGKLVQYQGGSIYWSAKTGARSLSSAVTTRYSRLGGPRGVLGYPTSDRVNGLRDGGWIQTFEKGAVVDSQKTYTQAVFGQAWVVWKASGREKGPLGYPVTDQHNSTGGWIQLFATGAIAKAPGSGAVVPVAGQIYDGWRNAGREAGVLGFPVAAAKSIGAVTYQVFEKGELWAPWPGAALRVYGGVLTAWKAAGGAQGRYGLPTSDTTGTSDGQLTCTFEHGTIVAPVAPVAAGD